MKKVILSLLLMGLLSLCWSQVQAKCLSKPERSWNLSRTSVRAVSGPSPTEEEIITETEKWPGEGILTLQRPVPPVTILLGEYLIQFW